MATFLQLKVAKRRLFEKVSLERCLHLYAIHGRESHFDVEQTRLLAFIFLICFGGGVLGFVLFSMSVSILGDALSAWTNLDKHSLFVWLYFVIV